MATSIIAVRTPNFVIIGGDSKTISTDGTGTGLICKIKKSNDIVYGYSGVLLAPSFSVSDIVEASHNGTNSMAERVASFEERVIPRLKEILTALKIEDPLGFERLVANPSVLDIVFASVESDTPKMMFRSFVVSVGPVEELVIEPKRQWICPGKDCPTGSIVWNIGANEAALNELKIHPSIWRDLGHENAVRHLVEDEILDRPDVVGEPVAVVRISKAGVTWISPGVCGN